MRQPSVKSVARSAEHTAVVIPDTASSVSSMQTNSSDGKFVQHSRASLQQDDVFLFDDPADDMNKEAHYKSKTSAWQWYSSGLNRQHLFELRKSKKQQRQPHTATEDSFSWTLATTLTTVNPLDQLPTRTHKRKQTNSNEAESPIKRHNTDGIMVGNTTPVKEAP